MVLLGLRWHCILLDLCVKVSGICIQYLDDPGAPWITVALDFIGPMWELPDSQHYVIVLIDVHIRWLEVEFMRDVIMMGTIRLLEKSLQEKDCLLTSS